MSLSFIYEYFSYNKDIVLAYENNFYTNIEKIMHILSTLNSYDKSTIYDYTCESAFRFYKLFKMNDKKWITQRNIQGDFFTSNSEIKIL